MKMPAELRTLYQALSTTWQAHLLKRLAERGIPLNKLCLDYEVALEISESARAFAEELKQRYLAKGTWKEPAEDLRYKEANHGSN